MADDAAGWAAEQVARVADEPQRRIALLARTYRGPVYAWAYADREVWTPPAGAAPRVLGWVTRS